MRAGFCLVRCFGAAVLALLLCGSALAQGYPTRPVRIIVPFPPGGGFDGIARPFAEKLTGILGQPAILENRPGAGGNIGLEAAKNAPADGYTLLVANEILSTNPSLYKAVPYDPVRDFAPISKLGTVPIAIAVNPTVPAKNPKELIALSKTKALNYGTPGVGTGPHLFGEALSLSGVMQLVHIPYKGSGLAITDAIGGQIELGVASVAAVGPHVKSGKLRAIAVTGDKRSHTMPDVPALSEQGYKGFSALAWWGIFAPAGTPKPILDKFHAELVKALNQPDLRKTLTETLGMDLAVSSPEDLQKFLLAEMARWGKVVRDNGIKPD